MLKKTITYTDFNDVERTEDFYFHLSKPELVRLQYGTHGGFDAVMQQAINRQNLPLLMKKYEEIILSAYGEKSPDGKSFDKDPEATKRFKNSNAYETLFMELFEDVDSFSKFMKAVVPKELAAEMEKQAAEAK